VGKILKKLLVMGSFLKNVIENPNFAVLIYEGAFTSGKEEGYEG
jgi:hypothetical protein